MSAQNTPAIHYPRKVFVRGFLRLLVRGLLPLLVRLEISGKEHFPKKGPIILAGNHTGVMEAVLMAVCFPRQVEFLGTGDIPFDPAYAWIVKLYGLIPVNRGNVDRKAIRKSTDVLRQGGVLGIFPEGGIWDPANMNAQIGVALISQKAQAPVLPIGFGGMHNALSQVLRFKRPRLSMHIGTPIAAMPAPSADQDRKTALSQYASTILADITALIPGEEQARQVMSQSYRLSAVPSHLGSSEKDTAFLPEAEGASLARFLLSPVLLDALARNLHLPIQALHNPQSRSSNADFRAGLAAVSGYLQQNPGFFTYRFGMDMGLQVGKALILLREYLQAADDAGLGIQLMAESHLKHLDGSEENRALRYTVVPTIKGQNLPVSRG